MLRSSTLAAAALAASLVLPAVASAQDEVVDCSNDDELFVERDGYTLYNPDCLRDQAARSQDALEAYQAGDLYEAVRIYESLIAVRPLNVYHLSLGRAYQKLNMCFEAREQFELANDSRLSIDVPNPPDVRGAVTKFRQELREQSECFGRVQLQCDPIGMTLDYDTLEYTQDAKSKAWAWSEKRVTGDICAKDTTLVLPPGEKKVTASYAKKTQEFVVQVQPMSQVIFPVTIKLDEPVKDPVIKDKDPVATKDPVRDGLNPTDGKGKGDTNVDVTVNIDNNKPKPNPVISWSLIGAGAAILVGGLLYDTCMFQAGSINTQVNDAVSSGALRPGGGAVSIDGGPMCSSVTWEDVNGPTAGGRSTGFNSAANCSCSGRVDRTFEASDAIGPAAYIIGSLLTIGGAVRF
jgi:hypothetical protein